MTGNGGLSRKSVEQEVLGSQEDSIREDVELRFIDVRFAEGNGNYFREEK